MRTHVGLRASARSHQPSVRKLLELRPFLDMLKHSISPASESQKPLPQPVEWFIMESPASTMRLALEGWTLSSMALTAAGGAGACAWAEVRASAKRMAKRAVFIGLPSSQVQKTKANPGVLR